MANKEIRQRIVLEGEAQYSQAIKEAQRNLRTLKSELKAETAELGKNATEQQKAEAKTKSLKQQIAEQEKIVKTLRAALQEVREKYGDNADEVARWEQKLNNARTSLANMKSDLEGVGSGLRTVSTDAAAATVATKSVADALGSISSAGQSVSDAIENVFTSMIDHVTAAAAQLWDLISETAAKANNWTDIAGYWGTDAQTIQQYARAVGASANSFEDLQSAVSRIVMGGKGKTIAELVGISDVNYANEWDYAMAVMGQLHQMSLDGQNMTPIYEQIFGERKSTKIMDLLNDWEAIQAFLPQFNGEGFGMSDDELGTMNDLWVKINEIEQKWDALKDKFAAGFGRVSMDLLVNVSGALDGIADYMNAATGEEREAALEKIRTNVEEFFRKLADVIRECIHILSDVGKELEGSDDPLTSAIGSAMKNIADALQWMVDNQDAVKTALEVIFGAWLIAKLTAVGGKLASIVAHIETIKAFKNWNPGGGQPATQPTTTPTTTPTTPPTPVVNPTTAGEAIAAAEALHLGGGGASAAGVGTGLGGAGSLTALGALGGTAVIAVGTYAISELVNSVNAQANKAREVEADAARYAGFGGSEASHEWGGLDSRYVLESYVNSLMRTTGGATGVTGPESILRRMAGGLGQDILSVFDYTNTSGESRNKLIDMLDMDDQNAAVAAMMLHAAGISTRDVDYSAQYAKYQELLRSGGMGYSTALGTLTDFFNRSGSWQDGRWTIPGYENTNGIMPVINGVPLASMSGYVMTSGAHKPLYSGTWDPSQHRDAMSFFETAEKTLDGMAARFSNPDWMTVTSSWWRGSSMPDENGVSSADLKGLQDMPAGVEAAAEKGVRKGISGLRVQIDGQDAGRILAPFVSAEIAKDIE